jgi:hypothetical protein
MNSTDHTVDDTEGAALWLPIHVCRPGQRGIVQDYK